MISCYASENTYCCPFTLRKVAHANVVPHVWWLGQHGRRCRILVQRWVMIPTLLHQAANSHECLATNNKAKEIIQVQNNQTILNSSSEASFIVLSGPNTTPGHKPRSLRLQTKSSKQQHCFGSQKCKCMQSDASDITLNGHCTPLRPHTHHNYTDTLVRQIPLGQKQQPL